MFSGTVEIQEYTFFWHYLLIVCRCLFVQSLKQNGSIYIHIYFTKSGFHPDPKRKAQYRRLSTVHATRSECPVFGCITSLIHLCDICVFAAHMFDCVSRPKITPYQCMGEPSLKPSAVFTRFLFNSAQQVQEEEVPQDQEPVDGRNRS